MKLSTSICNFKFKICDCDWLNFSYGARHVWMKKMFKGERGGEDYSFSVKPRSNGHDWWWWFQLSSVFEHGLSWAIINNHQLSCSLDMFKFDLIVDEIFLLFERADDQQFCQKQAQTEMANGKMTEVTVKKFVKYLVVHSHHFLVGFSIFNSQLLF